MPLAETPLLRVCGLTVRYGEGCRECSGGLEGNFCPECGTVWALRGVSLDLYPGEALGIVGESGSGKSTLLQCLYFDRSPTAGTAYLDRFKGGTKNIYDASPAERREIRSFHMGMVYQSPAMGLRMDYSSAGNIAEKMLSAGARGAGEIMRRAAQLLSAVEIPTERMREPPKNFSGGMQQRVQISKALATRPPLLLLDEVTTGLDPSVQARVLDLIRRIRCEFGVSILLVSHDLAVVRMLADRTVVLRAGRVVESGLTDQILEDPQHPYTQQLVHSMI